MIRTPRKICLPTFAALWLCACSAQAEETPLCSPEFVEAAQTAQSAEFSSQDSEARFITALSLIHCLGHPNSEIRDDLAYGSLTTLLRAGTFSEAQYRSIRESLTAQLNAPDPTSFTHPFIALVLAELARTDRVSPYFTDQERQSLVDQATDYLSSIDDYRGYSDRDGWRHGIAHGSDWLMQLSLNKNLTEAQAQQILTALATQIRPDTGHAYIHGEPGRLARPALFIAMRGLLDEHSWVDWIDGVSQPFPLENWGEAYKSERSLAHLHNVRAFLQALYINADVSQNENVKILLPPLTEALRSLP